MLNYGRFRLVIGKPKPNRPMVFRRPLPGCNWGLIFWTYGSVRDRNVRVDYVEGPDELTVNCHGACIGSWQPCWFDWVGFNVPLNTWWVISGTGFYGSNDPTNSVKALNEVVVLRIGFNPTRSTSPCYNTTQYTCMQYTYTKMNLNTVKWAQWDKTQSRELLGLFICVCIALCTIVAHNIARNKPDNFPSYPPDNHHYSDDVYLREGAAILLLNISTPCSACFDPVDSATGMASSLRQKLLLLFEWFCLGNLDPFWQNSREEDTIKQKLMLVVDVLNITWQ